jgi:proton-dependent oligopeptide transporter, POT family
MSYADPDIRVGNTQAASGIIGRAESRHPRGVLLVGFIELWERFSFFGVTGLLVLFLTGSSAAGGWGWSGGTALRFSGWYMGALMMAPLIGGWLSTRVMSERTCIRLGALLVTVGHAFFFLAYLSPGLLGQIYQIDIAALLRTPGLTMGAWGLDPAGAERITVALGDAYSHSLDYVLRHVGLAYTLNSVLFYTGMAFLFAGTALIKPAISSIVSEFYDSNDSRREEGFQILFMGLYAGCFLGLTIPGLIADRTVWHYGFSAAGLGMVIGLLFYLALQRSWLGSRGETIRRPPSGEAGVRIASRKALIYFGHGAFTVVYIALSYQIIGSFNLFVERSVDRAVLGFIVPATWIQSVSVISFLLWSPLLVLLWRYLDRKGIVAASAHKSAAALAVLTVSFALLLASVSTVGPGERIGLLWFAVPYFLIGLGDALLLPSQMALATRLGKPGREALLASGWYVFVGLGALASGYIGAAGSTLPMGTFLEILVATALVASVVYFALGRKLEYAD